MPEPHRTVADRMRAALRHAFHVDPPGVAVPTPEEERLLLRVVREVVARGMAQPALLFLESLRPLNGVGAQAMHFLQPFASVIVQPQAYERIAAFLERRGSIEWVCRAIEDADTARDAGNSGSPADAGAAGRDAASGPRNVGDGTPGSR